MMLVFATFPGIRPDAEGGGGGDPTEPSRELRPSQGLTRSAALASPLPARSPAYLIPRDRVSCLHAALSRLIPESKLSEATPVKVEQWREKQWEELSFTLSKIERCSDRFEVGKCPWISI
ncbi:uncharacterized protein PHA67_008232 [Liasis olivaceus]